MTDDIPLAEQPVRVLERPDHTLSRKNIDSNAIKVLYRLHNAGFKAYLVGGGVRDLLLGRKPKDFDAVTDARPNEIRRLFRNSRVIGRRFRLVHVYFKEGVVEVATFRRDPDPNEQKSAPGELLITSDNTFGTPRQDAFRRDFTVNALFYNIADYSVIDYVGGLDDLERRLIRTIGDPGVRFCEDPVRMLRACELAGRFGLGIEAETQEAIFEHRKELAKASPARMTEEIVELMRCGASGASAQWLFELRLMDVLLPEAKAMLRARDRELGDFARILPAIDELTRAGRKFSDAALLSALLLPAVLLKRHDLESRSGKALSRARIEEVVNRVVDPFVRRFTLSNARSRGVSDALSGFHRLAELRSPAARRRFARSPGFRDALELLEILVTATDEGHEALEAWREEAAAAPPPPTPPKRPGRGGRGRGARGRRGGGGGRRRGRGGRGRRPS